MDLIGFIWGSATAVTTALEQKKSAKLRKVKPSAQERFVTILEVRKVKEKIAVS